MDELTLTIRRVVAETTPVLVWLNDQSPDDIPRIVVGGEMTLADLFEFAERLPGIGNRIAAAAAG